MCYGAIAAAAPEAAAKTLTLGRVLGWGGLATAGASTATALHLRWGEGPPPVVFAEAAPPKVPSVWVLLPRGAVLTVIFTPVVLTAPLAYSLAAAREWWYRLLRRTLGARPPSHPPVPDAPRAPCTVRSTH